ncbi:hypothetical protein L218DRAFT_799202, partial [Marasmius fiardii PR-910]
LTIHYLSQTLESIDLIILARQYGVPGWLTDGTLQSACSDMEISHFDGERLGFHTTISLYHMKWAVR